MYGLMATNDNYPSASGIPCNGAAMLGGFTMARHLAAFSVAGVPGTTASYKLQVLMDDDDITSWVDVKNSTFSGNGAAATGHKVIPIVGQAVRVVADNGTTPGTGSNTPKYTLNVYPLKPYHCNGSLAPVSA